MKKYIFIALAAIAALSSCAKESLVSNDENGKEAQVFTATMEDGITTKVTFDATNKCALWEVGDAISIDGHTYSAEQAGASSTFTGSGATESTHHAYFPANLYNGGTPTLPAELAYAEGKFNMPMYAESSSLDLSFKNLCGVLAITVNGSDFTSVSSIEVSSDKQMNGEFTATADGVLTFASTTLTDALKRVTLTFASAKAIAWDGSATFYIPVPAGTHNPLTIDISNGTITKTMVTKKSGGVTVERNKVYSIDFGHNYILESHGYVVMKMGTNGDKRLKWATMNISTIDSNPQNIYFAWGDTDGQTWDGSVWSGSGFYSSSYTYPGILESLPSGKDAASIKWGDAWRMPTSAEFQDLYDACLNGTYDKSTYASTSCGATTSFDKGIYWCSNYDGKAGCLFCDGTNKVFFPISGNGRFSMLAEQNSGYYWSSTSNNSGKASAMRFTSTDIFPVKANNSASDGNFVRPVSN